MSPLTPDDVKRGVETSGKSLEVECATAFLKKNWDPLLSTYYVDSATDKPCELDVLSERLQVRDDAMEFRVRVLVSARGFPPNHFPIVYSITNQTILTLDPDLISFYRGTRSGFGPIRGVSDAIATDLLKSLRLQSGPIVGLDVLEESKDTGKKGEPVQRKLESVQRKGDRGVFGAVDSAVKAAVFWTKLDAERAMVGNALASLAIPLVVFPCPFWDVAIDDDRAPVERTKGYATCLYPMIDGTSGVPSLTPRRFLWLLCAVSSLDEMVRALTSAAQRFFEMTNDRWRS